MHSSENIKVQAKYVNSKILYDFTKTDNMQ